MAFQKTFNGFDFKLSAELSSLPQPLQNGPYDVVLIWKRSSDGAYHDTNKKIILSIMEADLKNMGAIEYLKSILAAINLEIKIVCQQLFGTPAPTDANGQPATTTDVYTDLNNAMATLTATEADGAFSVAL